MLNLGNLKMGAFEEDDHNNRAQHMNELKEVIEAVSENLEELHIHENALTDEDFYLTLLPSISKMPKLRMLNLARNG